MCPTSQTLKRKSQWFTSEIYEQILLTKEFQLLQDAEEDREDKAKRKVKVAGLWEISDTF